MTTETERTPAGCARELPPCPRCGHMTLDAPGHCPSCGTIRLFEVSEPRQIRATYRRQIWAVDEGEALKRHAEGTAWPSSYDEDREEVICGQASVSDVTETGSMRGDGGFEDPT